MPVKRRLAKYRLQKPLTWETLTNGERAWLQGEPTPEGAPFGEQWGFTDDQDKVDLWRPGRPTASELLKRFAPK
jgi:hypothetical protein